MPASGYHKTCDMTFRMARLTRGNAAFLIPAVALGCIAILESTPAKAARFYFEMGAGVAQIRGGTEFFDSASGIAASSTLSLGFAANAAIAFRLSAPDSPIKFHVGAQHRYDTGAQDTLSYSVQATYPFIRAEAGRFFLSTGVTPLIWKRTGSNSSIDGISRAAGAYAGMLEAGYLWPITPEAAFDLTGSAVVMSNSGTLGPKPILGLCAGLRFYIGGPGTSRDTKPAYERSDGSYEGWRYPFGYPR